MNASQGARGFTLIELLTAMLVLSLLALMSYRGLGAVLDAREQVNRETDRWQQIAAFFDRFEQDVRLAAPRKVRSGNTTLPAWVGSMDAASASHARSGSVLAFSRFAATESTGMPQRVAYLLNAGQDIELLLWPGLDLAQNVQPARHTVLRGVTVFECEYLNADLLWVKRWPSSPADAAIPLAIRLRIVIASGEEIIRVFALNT